jgi:hypothetical protein
MQLDETMMQKVQALELLTNKPAEEILNEALDMYLRVKQEEEAEKQRQETTLSYDEFWDGVDI